MNLKPQQPLIGMIFTNADPRYAGRFDDKQGGDTIVTLERVKEANGLQEPTVVIWESLSQQEKASWLEEASTMHDWVVWCKSKKGAV